MKRILLFIAFSWSAANGQPSVLSNGQWARMSVAYDAVYIIDYNLFQQMGFNPGSTDPRRIKIFGGQPGMLPQANQQTRITDLQELAILITGADDGKFDPGDYILFFGQGPDEHNLLAGSGTFQYINHLYSNKNFYFITVGSSVGKRMQTISNIAGSYPVISAFDDFQYYETERQNILHSGRDWYGEQFDSQSEYTIRFDMPGIVAGSEMKLISRLMAQSYAACSFQIYMNDQLMRQLDPVPIPNSSFEEKGTNIADTLLINVTTVGAASRTNQDVRIKFNKAPGVFSIGNLDYLLLQSSRHLSLYGDQTLFQSLKSTDQAISSFIINAMPVTGMVWDVTDPFNTQLQQGTWQAGTFSFSATSTSVRKYLAVSASTYTAPIVTGNVTNQNLHGLGAADLVIITAPEFLSEATRLAAHRTSKSGLQIHVVTTQQVYNEFAGGKQDVTAIRDFVKFLYDNGSGIQYLLLFGRGSYDYKDILTFNKNFVPIYESRNSLDPLTTYSSDDYYGFLENSEGNWGEDPVEPHTLDISVGRLPVKDLEDAKNIVDKIIQYESDNWGDWQKEILFVADDGDFNTHQSQSDQMAELVETLHPEINTSKIFLDAFTQTTSSVGEISKAATDALVNSVRKGAVILNYTGHGNEQQLMQEKILDPVSLDRWKTKPRYPLMVTATCEFGRNDDPGLLSTAELALFRKDGGVIGLVTTARPVNSGTNFTLNQAFYQSLFIKSGDSFRDIGTVFRETKNNSMSGVSNRNFSLLADPTLHIALPDDKVVVTGITNLTSGSDTLKGLSKVRINGEVRSLGVLNSAFDGKLSLTLFDKLTTTTTLGNESAATTFTQWDNVVFKGQAPVHQGEFEIEFVMPSAIDPAVSTGKMSLYTYSPQGHMAGVEKSMKIGDLESMPGVDTDGPIIQLFIGDTTFVNGGYANANTHIVANLSDNNGINTSGFKDQYILQANLDDTLQINLNEYYQASIAGFQEGRLDYPFLENLKSGQHHLTLRASDTFGNTSTSTITFYVSDQNGLQIEQLLNYPNPVSESTTFHFKHNRSGEDLEVNTAIYNAQGQIVMSAVYHVPLSAYQVDLPAWDASLPDGTKLGSGLYLLKLSVRSLLDGSKNEKITKVIIFN